jgi:hypothetical protein
VSSLRTAALPPFDGGTVTVAFFGGWFVPMATQSFYAEIAEVASRHAGRAWLSSCDQACYNVQRAESKERARVQSFERREMQWEDERSQFVAHAHQQDHAVQRYGSCLSPLASLDSHAHVFSGWRQNFGR